MGAHGLPQWAPLEKVVPAEQRNNWMWMGFVDYGNRRIEQYKHCDSRGYLNLDAGGQPWQVHHPAGADKPQVQPLGMGAAMDRARNGQEVRCPYCRAVLPGLLAACTQPACLSRDLDDDMRHTRMEDQ